MQRKIFITLIIAIITVLGVSAQVKAEGNSFKASLTANSTELKPGQEVTVTLAVSDINMGDNGINTVEGIIEYDKTIFEELKTTSVQSLNNWTTTLNTENSSNNGKFLAVNLTSGIKESMQIFSVKFKVKEDIESTTETEIKYKDITSNDGTDLVSVGTKSIKIKVNVETNTPAETKTSENKTTQTNTSNTTKNTAETKDKTGSATILPKTGKSFIGIAMVGIVLIVSIVLWIKNRSMRDIK